MDELGEGENVVSLQHRVEEQQALLDGLVEQLKELQAMINNAKSGNGTTSIAAVESLQQSLLKEELERRVALAKARKRLAGAVALSASVQTPSTSVATLPATTSASTSSSSSMLPPQKKQMTLSGFVLIKSADGRFRELSGPKVITGIEDLTCNPGGCGKVFKNILGLKEHRRYCGLYKSSFVASQAKGEVQELKRERIGLMVEREAPHRFPPTAAPDHEESSNDESDVSEAAANGQVRGPQRGADVRLRYTNQFKFRVARLVEGAIKDIGAEGAQTLVADKSGLPLSNVSRWYRDRDNLRRLVLTAQGKRGRGNKGFIAFADSSARGPQPRFQAAEAVVLAKFERARENGVRVGPTLIKLWMKAAVRQVHPNQTAAQSFMASSTWLQKFLRRHDLVERRATNKKELSVLDRLLKVQKWHKRLQRDVTVDTPADPVFGKYRPENIMNSDQVPFSIGDVLKTTYAKKGASTVRIASQKSSDKRFATLQLCVSLGGKTQCAPMVIFKGQGNITQAERDQYDSRVHVMFQKKAWMDGKIFKAWIEGPLKDHVDVLPAGPKVMILDNLRAQTVDESGDALTNIGVDRRLLPAGVTDMIQPIDQNVGYDIKRRMIEILTTRLAEDDEFRNRWLGREDHPTFPAKERRILVTELLGQAWQEFVQKKDFLALGLTSGCVMPMRGVLSSHPRINGRRIEIKGVDDYSFDHVDIEIHEEPDEPTELGEAVPQGDVAEGHVADKEVDELEGPVDTEAAAAPAAPARAPAALATKQGKASKSTTSRATDVLDSSCPLLTPTVDPLFDDNDDTKIVAEPMDVLLDDTSVLDLANIPPPEGYRFAQAPDSLPPISKWLNRLIYWRSQLSDGELLNKWILTEIIGGPADPSEAMAGVTMRLKCSRRLDRSTPPCLQSKHGCIVQVALTAENYGSKWYLMEKV